MHRRDSGERERERERDCIARGWAGGASREGSSAVRSRLVTATGVVEVPEATIADAVRTEDGLVWVDLDHTDERGMALLPQLFDVRPTDLEDCYTRTPVPKLHLYPDHHYTAINGLSRGSNTRLYF